MGLVPTLPVARMEEGADLLDGAGAQVRRGAASGPQGQAHPACGLGPGQGCRKGLGGSPCQAPSPASSAGVSGLPGLWQKPE